MYYIFKNYCKNMCQVKNLKRFKYKTMCEACAGF